MTRHLPQRFRSFLNPKAIIFGACVLNFLVSLMFVRRAQLEAQAAMAAGHWAYSDHWSPINVMWEPLLLLVAVVGLLVNQWWSLLLALLASGRVIYLLGYLSWRAIHFAHDVPMFSWQAAEKLWNVIYWPRPQNVIEVILSTGIFVYVVLVLGKSVYIKFGSSSAGG